MTGQATRMFRPVASISAKRMAVLVSPAVVKMTTIRSSGSRPPECGGVRRNAISSTSDSMKNSTYAPSNTIAIGIA